MANQMQAQAPGAPRQVTEKQWLEAINGNLTKELMNHKGALPKGFNDKRFTMNCVTMLQDMLRDSSKKNTLKQCNPTSIVMCLAKGAYLGLDFFNGECYAIPYGKDMNFQTDYKGEVKLCKKYSKNPIKDIYAKLVREGDEFEEAIENGAQNINFRPRPFSDAPIIGAFAVVLYADGSMMYETMSATEIEGIRIGFSKASNSPAWKKTPGEMYKKTVLRRLCKNIDLDFDNIEQSIAFADGGDADFHAEQAASDTVYDALSQPVMDDEPQQIQSLPAPEPAIKTAPTPVAQQTTLDGLSGDEAPINSDEPLPF